MPNLRDQMYDVLRRLPERRSDRVKLICASVCIVLCLVWLSIFVGGNIGTRRTAVPLNTDGWKVANGITNDLVEKHGLLDVSVGVVSERPLKLKVVGMVRTDEDLAALEHALKEARPDQEYEMEVVVMPKP